MLTKTSQYPDVLRSLKGFVVVPIHRLPELRPHIVVYVRRRTMSRGERFFAGTVQDRDKAGRVQVWLSKFQRTKWFDQDAVQVVIAS